MACTHLDQRAILLIKITDMLTECDRSIKDICRETGAYHATVSRMIKDGIKKGRFVCVAKTKRVITDDGLWGGVIAARYSVAEGREQRAETLIYRLLDKLVDHPLDEHEIALVREAQQFINVEIFRGEL